MNLFKAIVIDDERLARKELIRLLSCFPQLSVVAEADSVSSAIKAITKNKPDVIFLDIQLTGETGFDLLKKVNPDFHVVFISAFNVHAIKAFEINADDYLLKPVNPERLEITIERLFSRPVMYFKNPAKYDYNDSLFVKINNFLRVIKINSILSISSYGDYSYLQFTDGKRGLVLRSMKRWEEILPDKHFVRIHRSYIININHIERIENWFNASLRVYLNNITEPQVVSRRFAWKIKERLN